MFLLRKDTREKIATLAPMSWRESEEETSQSKNVRISIESRTMIHTNFLKIEDACFSPRLHITPMIIIGFRSNLEIIIVVCLKIELGLMDRHTIYLRLIRTDEGKRLAIDVYIEEGGVRDLLSKDGSHFESFCMDGHIADRVEGEDFGAE